MKYQAYRVTSILLLLNRLILLVSAWYVLSFCSYAVFSEKIFQENLKSVKEFGSRSGLTKC